MYRPEDTNLTGGSHERDETVLDAALEELLSGEGPPDMSGRILRAHAAGRIAGDLSSIPLAVPVAPPVAAPPVLPPALPVAWVSPNGRGANRSRRPAAAFGQQWTGIAVAAGVLVAGVGVTLFVALYSNGRLGGANRVANIERPSSVVNVETPPRHETSPTNIAQRSAPIDNPFDNSPFGVEDLAASPTPGVPWQVPYAIEPQQSDKIVAFVDEKLTHRWNAAGVKPAAEIDDAAWAERVTEQLLGRAPTDDEAQAFAADRSPQKRAALVKSLLHHDKHRAEFARHWAKVWASELAGGASDAQREGLEQYLGSALAADKPFSQITHELLTATGSSDPHAADFNGATNFVLSGISGQRENIAGTVSRVFLGHQGQCVQCHDAKRGGDDAKQQQFWQIAAFFQQARPLRDASGVTRLVDADYVGMTGDVDEAELFYDRPDRQRKIAYPVFIDGQAISPSGRVAEVNRRAELARLVVNSEAFSQASVNEWWSHLLGRGLTSASATSRDNAELQHRLAEQFAAHGFDQKQLIEWIVLSEANTRAAGGDGGQLANAPLFDRFYGDETATAPYDTFAAALDAAQRGARPLGGAGRGMFARLAPTRPSNDDAGSIIVRSAASLRKLDPRDYTLVDRMIASDMTYADKVKHLFLSGTGRAPSSAELQAAQETLTRYEGSVVGAIQELWWAIENSNEYKPLD